MTKHTAPEIVGLSLLKEAPLNNELEIYSELWEHHIFGMVGALWNGQIFVCGGMVFHPGKQIIKFK